MSQAQMGDTVRVHYVGRMEDGTEFSSRGEPPLELELGNNRIMPQLDANLVGMHVGDSKRFSVEPKDAFGNYRRDLVVDVPKSEIPPELDLGMGKTLKVPTRDGSVSTFTITDVNDDTVRLDGNHPFAGKRIHFQVTLIEIL